jgi:hypothetical protein
MNQWVKSNLCTRLRAIAVSQFTAEAHRNPEFAMKTKGKDLLWNGVIAFSGAKTSRRWREISATFVIGTDGRNSIAMTQRAGLWN